MLFCDRYTAFVLDLYLTESLWLKKKCKVGPIVELQTIIHEFIGANNHKTTTDCPSETFTISGLPASFIVRHGELLGVYIDDGKLTLRSPLDNNRFVMELNLFCLKGSFIDYNSDDDRLMAYDQDSKYVLVYDLGSLQCVSMNQLHGLNLSAERYVARYAAGRLVFCFATSKGMHLYDAKIDVGIHSVQVRELTELSFPGKDFARMDMKYYPRNCPPTINIYTCSELEHYCHTVHLDDSDPLLILRTKMRPPGSFLHSKHPVRAPFVCVMGPDAVSGTAKDEEGVDCWWLKEISGKAQERLAPVTSGVKALAAGSLPHGTLYVVTEPCESSPTYTIRVFHRYRGG
ncbi:hypothetical protein FOL47_002470 [Perkinsus chesapeaki]|uniref:Uncharacterized protein n=1 Tax=Perkinsus chesapeaki TaxID=330153 RepID=A0A7J6MD39_PERCH|nr:hypothetical protein FOL47_002470 [Perkinsus chesapeaki]